MGPYGREDSDHVRRYLYSDYLCSVPLAEALMPADDEDAKGQNLEPAAPSFSTAWKRTRMWGNVYTEEEEEDERGGLPFGFDFEFLSGLLPISCPSGDRQEATASRDASQSYLPTRVVHVALI